MPSRQLCGRLDSRPAHALIGSVVIHYVRRRPRAGSVLISSAPVPAGATEPRRLRQFVRRPRAGSSPSRPSPAPPRATRRPRPDVRVPVNTEHGAHGTRSTPAVITISGAQINQPCLAPDHSSYFMLRLMDWVVMGCVVPSPRRARAEPESSRSRDGAEPKSRPALDCDCKQSLVEVCNL